MSRSKKNRKATGRGRSVTVLGLAGALSLAGGASASIAPSGDEPAPNAAQVVLAEEEISDVSLATFYVFDRENAGADHGVQLARGGHRGCRHGCRGCGHGYGYGGCRGCGGWGYGGCGGGEGWEGGEGWGEGGGDD